MAHFGVFSDVGWLPVTFYAGLLIFSATCQYFFFDSPIYLPLSKQSNWYIPGWLSGSSFGFFWHKMPWKFLPDVKVKSLFTFLNFFPNFWPSISYPLDFFLSCCNCNSHCFSFWHYSFLLNFLEMFSYVYS